MKKPDNNPKSEFGVKKTPLSLLPPEPLRQMAEAMRSGADKYGPYNWRESGISSSIYISAAMRHILAFADGEDKDPESGLAHLAHGLTNLAILLDGQHHKCLNDDRPSKKNMTTGDS